MMGYVPEPVQWQEIDYVYTYTTPTASQIALYLRISSWMLTSILNEEFDEAMISFDLVSIVYHDFDEFWGRSCDPRAKYYAYRIARAVSNGWTTT